MAGGTRAAGAVRGSRARAPAGRAWSAWRPVGSVLHEASGASPGNAAPLRQRRNVMRPRPIRITRSPTPSSPSRIRVSVTRRDTSSSRSKGCFGGGAVASLASDGVASNSLNTRLLVALSWTRLSLRQLSRLRFVSRFPLASIPSRVACWRASYSKIPFSAPSYASKKPGPRSRTHAERQAPDWTASRALLPEAVSATGKRLTKTLGPSQDLASWPYLKAVSDR